MMTINASVKRLARRVPFARDLRRELQRTIARLGYWHDFRTFSQLQASTVPRFSLRWRDRYPCLDDKTAQTDFDHHYLYHTAWAARVVAQIHPAYHVDISSSLYFSALVSAFVPVKFYDYRPAPLHLSQLTSEHADLMRLPFADGGLSSLSCMHVVEHIGLGRYGDPLDPNGDLKAIAELNRVLAPGGNLLFVVPIGRPKIAFNAHRIYTYDHVLQIFNGLQLRHFALVDDPGNFIESGTRELADAQTYGCGCFWFQRGE